MKWTYSIQNKLTASGVLLLLCLLVLYSNYIDRNHTKNVKRSISTLYEDRLVAEVYILKMTSAFYQLKEVIQTGNNLDSDDINAGNLLAVIKEESSAYQKTKFTALERRKADSLLNILREFETIKSMTAEQRLAGTDKALSLLRELSVIQVEESKQIMAAAEELYTAGKISSQFVFAIIIVLLVVLQALVFASKTLKPTHKNTPTNLN